MQLLAWSVFIPLIASFILLLAKTKRLQSQRVIGLLSLCISIVLSYNLIEESLSGVHQVYLLGNWAAPFGIVLVLDQLSALMVGVTSLMALAALVYAIATDTDSQGEHFHVLFQLLLFGLYGAFLTGDIFNLFVFFEVLLLASYGLLLHGGGKQRTRAGLHYVVINLLSATLFLFAVGTLYGVLGTLNIADLAQKIAQLPEQDSALVAAAGLLLLVVFGVKAALFPLYLWLPGAYTHTSAAVAALFAIMTKVGIYAIVRVHGTLFSDNAGVLSNYYVPWVLALGLLTLVLAALGVMAARGLREQVAYLVLTSVATLLVAVGVQNQLALSGALYYLIHSTLIAGGMFLLADMIAGRRGRFADRFESGYAMHGAILMGSMFMFAAVAMTGMPPLSGFFGKVLILSASLEHNWSSVIFGVVLISGFIMIISMARSGSVLFYQLLADDESANKTGSDVSPNGPVKTPTIVIISLFLASPLLVIFAQPLTTFTESAAKQQYNSDVYIEAVLSQQPVLRKP